MNAAVVSDWAVRLMVALGLALASGSFPPQIPPSCPQFPARNAPGVLCEDFDTERNGVPGFQFTRLPVAMDPNDPLRAIGDPGDDVLGYTQHGGASPAGTAAQTCTTPDDFGFFDGSIATCTAAVASENDWHLHSPFEGPGTGYDPPNRPGIGAPDGGKAHSGSRSMHWGRHTSATGTLGDTSRFRQISAFVLDPPIVPGPAATMEFWHIISVPDDENAGQGFIPPGTTFGGGQVQVSLLGSNGRYERWRRLNPAFNGYDSTIQESVSICEFDPGDDEEPPNDETMCDHSPMWADLGDVIGTDATCATDTDGNDPDHKDCGAISSCTGGPGCTERGSIGTGVWAKSAFDLSSFAGRQARIRWIGSEGGGWSFGASRSFMEPFSGIAYQYYDGDDGWWIDDIILTDVLEGPAPCDPDGDGDGVALCDGDCDDSNAAIYPGAPPLCDGLNNDCRDPDWPALAGSEEVDDDGDGLTECGRDCNDTSTAVYPGAPELCDGLANDCSDPGWAPGTPAGETNFDADSYRVCHGDCDDTDPTVYPGAPQACDGLNNDCNDPTWPDPGPSEANADGDAYPVCLGDCDDSSPLVYPGASQICGDGLNNDCNSATWPDLRLTNEYDDDGDGYTECGGDCTDGNAGYWGRPTEARDLTFTDVAHMSWSPPADPGGTFVMYDLIRTPAPNNFGGIAACVESNDFDTVASEPDFEFPVIRYYLVRAENFCPGTLGQGIAGMSSSGVPAPARSCP